MIIQIQGYVLHMRNDRNSGSKAGISHKVFPNLVILKQILGALFPTMPNSYDITLTGHVISRGVQKRADCPHFYLPKSQKVYMHPSLKL